MARIRIGLPDKFNFSTSIPVRISDVNYGGHVGNDSILSIIHEARLQFLKSLSYTELDFGGVSLIMSDVAIEFKTEAFYGDVIIAAVTASDISRVGFDLYYKLSRISNGSEHTIAIAKTGMICFDYDTRKVVAIPETIKEQLNVSGGQ
jgi:YbgC/YbaW family acyl-CoA thioester hydrolase